MSGNFVRLEVFTVVCGSWGGRGVFLLLKESLMMLLSGAWSLISLTDRTGIGSMNFFQPLCACKRRDENMGACRGRCIETMSDAHICTHRHMCTDTLVEFDKKKWPPPPPFSTTAVSQAGAPAPNHSKGAVKQKMSSRLPVSPPTWRRRRRNTCLIFLSSHTALPLKCLAIYLPASGWDAPIQKTKWGARMWQEWNLPWSGELKCAFVCLRGKVCFSHRGNWLSTNIKGAEGVAYSLVDAIVVPRQKN